MKRRMFIVIVAVLATVLGPSRQVVAAPVAPLPFDHILRYDELTKFLHSWADARPDLQGTMSH